MESTMQENKEKNNRNSKISKQTHIIEEPTENGEINYNCTACGKVFRSRSQKYYHINCNQLQNLIYKCEHCDKCFGRQTQWKYHIKSHLSPINECHKCQKTFSNPLALKKHIGLHEVEPKTCPHCDKTFKKKISLDQHIAAQHLNQLQFGCAYCSKKYVSKSSLQLHLQTHEKKRFECTFCGKLFQRNSILNLHLRRHYKTNNYSCAVCGKVFSESGALARHRKIHEDRVSQYYCKLCDKSILRKDNMKRHLITIHPGEKFDNFIQIMKPSITSWLSGSVEGSANSIYKSRHEDVTKPNKEILIIENKLLQKPIDRKESEIDIQQIVEYPLTNQITVITAVPTYKTENFVEHTKHSSQEYLKHCKNTNQQQEDSILFNNQENSSKNKFSMATKVNIIESNNNENSLFCNYTQNHLEKFNQPYQKIVAEDKCQKFLHSDKVQIKIYDSDQQQSVAIDKRPVIENSSSVIRSVGNVKKSLTSYIETKSDKCKDHMSPEYKHKKYCRNNYNIDLYRKILGCDEEDDVEDLEKQHKFDTLSKSPTPVHWRKYFKNNYETSSLQSTPQAMSSS